MDRSLLFHVVTHFFIFRRRSRIRRLPMNMTLPNVHRRPISPLNEIWLTLAILMLSRSFLANESVCVAAFVREKPRLSGCVSRGRCPRQYNVLTRKTDSGDYATTESSFTRGDKIDEEYPYRFTGRFWFCPAIVRTPSSTNSNNPIPTAISFLGLGGYTLGGTVALEYDSSPVGPYREYVTMSSVVGGVRRLNKNLASDSNRGLGWWTLGQFGGSLYVSTKRAKDICEKLWGVPAKHASIDFQEDNDFNNGLLQVTEPPDEADRNVNSFQKQTICVSGWKNTRILAPSSFSNQKESKRWGNLPVLWTPTIKSLWAAIPIPAVFGVDPETSATTANNKNDRNLPVHKLRLSASAIRIKWSGFQARIPRTETKKSRKTFNDNSSALDPANDLGFPLGFGLVVDNVLIEIGNECGIMG